MSTRTTNAPKSEGLSVTTLAIASVSSVAAAVFIHKFWTGGAILGAGITPVIVAITSEMLKRPTKAITAIREERRDRTSVARDTRRDVPTSPPPELERADPFGIWEADKQRRSGSAWDRIKGRPLKIALATGVIAFLVAAFATTGAQLVFGSGDDGGDRLVFVPGKQKKSASDDTTRTTTTKTTETTETQPEEDEEPAQTTPQTVPTTPQTVPTTPQQTVPTTPQTVPTTPAPAPATPESGGEVAPQSATPATP